MKNWLQPTSLRSKLVELSPLLPEHRAALLEAASDGELWKLWYTTVPSADSIDRYLDYAFSEQDQGRSLPFVVRHVASGDIIGSTRYCNATPEYRRLEIGYTWYAHRHQRTAVNTMCKYLLLTHAFEELKAVAVEFRTHWHNQRSRRAILRLGARQDGILRNHKIDQQGNLRDTVVFSIIDSEWPTVRYALQHQMESH